MSSQGCCTRYAGGASVLTPKGEKPVKNQVLRADRCVVTEYEPGERRAATALSGAATRLGMLRRLGRALRDGLYRPLAGDDDRVAYWIRHVRNGVVLTEVCVAAVLGYVVLTPDPAPHDGVIMGIALFVALTTPGLLLLPLGSMMRDHRGPMLFYGWSIATTAAVSVASRLDGGSSSPLFSLLFVTLAFMAAAYPPYGVVTIGAIMTASYLLFVAMPDVTYSALFFASVMGAFTMICTLSSSNAWAAYDRQVLLMRTQETLAATDPLTSIPNRRAFLDRLSAAVDVSAWGHPTVVCLVDLDGFKAVNDAGGHAAGDAVLKAVASALAGAVRETDTVARLGGDEFAVLADDSVSFSGEMLAERLREAVSGVGAASGVTASVGVAEVHPGDDVEDLMHRADAAMYRSKTAGGDRVTALVF